MAEDRKIAVYCGSSLGNKPEYAAEARKVAQLLAQEGMGLVFGAGSIGIMGEVADEMLKAGSYVHGVIPQFLYDREVALETCTKLTITVDMHTRKALMAEEADAFLILPGGIGTMDEFFEVLTWKQLGLHDKPIAIYNVDGVFSSLTQLLQDLIHKGFLGTQIMAAVRITDSFSGLQDYVRGIRPSRKPDDIIRKS